MRPKLAILTIGVLSGCGGPARMAVLPSVEQLPQPGKAHLVGAVSDDHDKAFSYTQLSLWRRIGDDTLVMAGRQVADSVGGFAFHDVVPGAYFLDAQFIGTSGGRQAVWLAAGSVDTVAIRLRTVKASIPEGH